MSDEKMPQDDLFEVVETVETAAEAVEPAEAVAEVVETAAEAVESSVEAATNAAVPSPEPETLDIPAIAVDAAPAEKKGGLEALKPAAWIGIAVATLVLGILVGKFALGGAAAGAAFAGKTTLTEAELEGTVASYSFNGNTATLSAKEVLEKSTGLDAAKDEEGNYKLPSADAVLSTARNAIIEQEAKSRGVEATDEDLAEYAETNLGSSDFASLATSYGMSEETIKTLLRSTVVTEKLRNEVVEGEIAPVPDAPAEAAEDKQDEKTAEYAEYIKNLAGDEWDAKNNKWVAEDGPYATALAEYEVGDTANYKAAQAAYYVAYQKYAESQAEVSGQWEEFVNGILSNASISINTMVS